MAYRWYGPLILRSPDLDAHSAAFSLDGTRIITASHKIHVPAASGVPAHIENSATWAMRTDDHGPVVGEQYTGS